MAVATSFFDFSLLLKLKETDPAVGAGNRPKFFEHEIEVVQRLQNGTGELGQDVVWSDRRAISAADNLDLRGGVVSAVDGSALNFPLVTTILIRHLGGSGEGTLTIGGATSAFDSWVVGAGDSVILGPGGVFLLHSPIDGYATVAGTDDLLRVLPSAGTINYDVLVVGRQS